MSEDKNNKKSKLNKLRNMGERPISIRSRKNEYISPNIKKVEIEDIDAEDKKLNNSANVINEKDKNINKDINKNINTNTNTTASKNLSNGNKVKIVKTNKNNKDKDKNKNQNNHNANQKVKQKEEEEEKSEKREVKKKVVNEKEKAAFIEKMDSVKKLSKDEKDGAYKKGIIPLIEGILLITYTFVLIILYYKCAQNVCEITYKVMSLVLLGASITLFEVAYKKENGELALLGVEILVLALLTLIGTYVYIIYKDNYQLFMTIVGVSFAAYFIIKMGVRFLKAKKKHNDNISDIKKIIVEEE